MRRRTTGIRFEKCVVRRFRRRANVIERTYTNIYSIATHAIWNSLLLLGYKPVQHVTVLNTVDSCNTMVLYYNHMGPPSYMRPVVDRNIVMRRIPFIIPTQCICVYRIIFRTNRDYLTVLTNRPS